MAEAGALDADLLVLGARGLAGLRAYVGSVSNHVLHHVHRPLLIVPPSGDAPATTAEARTAAVATSG